ncbi:MAG: hypothetical protein ACFHX7_15605 [Pseudomonadota bacterium]
MIYFIGGAPRVGKSTLCQMIARSEGFGWLSTDLIAEVLREAGVKLAETWDADPERVRNQCETFFPFLERFSLGLQSMTQHYVIEGVDFLPHQLNDLKSRINLRAIFLGRSIITPQQVRVGKSPGYAQLSESLCKQIAADVPRWSSWVEAQSDGYTYIDMARGDFDENLKVASSSLLDFAGSA